MLQRAYKQRRCACGCGAWFTPSRGLQRVKDWKCAQRYAEQKRIKEEERAKRKAEAEERKTLRARKEAIKNASELRAEAQTAFNAFIRFRDRFHACICCGKPFEPMKVGGSMDAGHFRSVGSAPHLRFNEDNCHGQRKSCNRPGGTTHAKYRAGLIGRIGLERVEVIESDHEPMRYRADDYRRIRDEYRAKLKALKSGGAYEFGDE